MTWEAWSYVLRLILSAVLLNAVLSRTVIAALAYASGKREAAPNPLITVALTYMALSMLITFIR